MEVKSTIRFARVSSTKVYDLARVIRGLPAAQALQTLQFSHRKGAFLLGKALKSAVANAENNFDLSAETLYVKEAAVETGPSLKRIRAKARGMAARIVKRSSHIRIVLAERPAAAQPRKEPHDRGTEG